jgi:hypothetical protein
MLTRKIRLDSQPLSVFVCRGCCRTTFNYQGGSRGQRDFRAQDWLMVIGSRQLGRGMFGVSAMGGSVACVGPMLPPKHPLAAESAARAMESARIAAIERGCGNSLGVLTERGLYSGPTHPDTMFRSL